MADPIYIDDPSMIEGQSTINPNDILQKNLNAGVENIAAEAHTFPGQVNEHTTEIINDRRVANNITYPSGPLHYPIENREAYSARVEFRAKTLQPIDTEWTWLANSYVKDNEKNYFSGGALGAAAGLFSGGNTEDTVAETKEDINKKNEQRQAFERSHKVGRQLNSNSVFRDNTAIPKISLSVEQPFQIPNSVAYQGVELGALGAGVLEAAGNQSILGAMQAGVSKALVDPFRIMKSDDATLAKLGVTRLAALAPGKKIQVGVQIATQTAINPNLRTTFSNVNIREYSFTFKFIPTSPAEANIINKIIKTFKMAMYPEPIQSVSGGYRMSLGYKLPDLFDIRFKYRGRDARMSKLEYCYLRNVSTTYNPTQQVFFKDGQPSEIDMTLSFMEYRALNKEDMMNGY